MSAGPAQDAPRISVVLCTYDDARWSELRATIASLQAQRLRPAQLIVVVDHNQRLFERVQSELAQLHTVSNREARGLSGSRNTGISKADGDIVAFIDDDAVASEQWIQGLSRAYDDPSVVAAGGAVLPLWFRGRPRWFPEEFDWVVGCTYRGMARTAAPVRNLLGCNMSFRREVFARVGGFRSGIGRLGQSPLGCEETELCIRIHQRWPDRTVVFDPSVQVYHRVPRSRSGLKYYCSRCYAEGISKAQVTRTVGARAALSTERAYVRLTLLHAMGRSIGRAIHEREPDQLKIGLTVALGLALTASGYVSGSARALLPITGYTRSAAPAIGLP